MLATRLESHFQQCSVCNRLQNAVSEASFLRLRMRLRGNVHLAVPLVLTNPIDTGAFRGVRGSFDDRPVDFLDDSVTELFGEPTGGFGCSRDEQNASDRSVQAADDA